jgi:hypothetical protein
VRRLLVTDGTREREVLVVGTIVVGRDPTCDITGTDDLLSRRHAEFTLANNRVFVRDLGSRNGVFVNSTRVAEHALNSNDIVQIGQLKIRYVSDDRPITRAAVPTPAFSTIEPPALSTMEDDVTGYRPAPSGAAPPNPIGAATVQLDEDVTSFVGARTAVNNPADAGAPVSVDTPAKAGSHTGFANPADTPAKAGIVFDNPAKAGSSRTEVGSPRTEAGSSRTMAVIPGAAVALVSAGVVVWQASKAGAPVWLLAPLLLALAASAAAGAALAGKPSRTGSSGLKGQ